MAKDSPLSLDVIFRLRADALFSMLEAVWPPITRTFDVSGITKFDVCWISPTVGFSLLEEVTCTGLTKQLCLSNLLYSTDSNIGRM